MADKARVVLRGRFPAGTKVQLRERHGDYFTPNSAVVKTTTVRKDGTTVFDRLAEGTRYWVAAEIDGVLRSAMVTAKVAPEPKERIERPTDGSATPPGRSTTVEVERVTKTRRELSERVAQRDVPASVVQRSATPLGMATPKDPNEVVPALPQSEVPKGVVQRSDTPHGAATVKPVEDEAPAVRQEDAKGRQRSDTPTGAAAPKPVSSPRRPRSTATRRKAAVKAAQDRDAEASQKALREGAQKVRGGSTGRTRAQRSAAAKKAAATRKRNAAQTTS